MSKEKEQGPKMVNVKALKVRQGKKQNMEVDRVYEVTEELSKSLIANKSAVLTSEPEGAPKATIKAADITK